VVWEDGGRESPSYPIVFAEVRQRISPRSDGLPGTDLGPRFEETSKPANRMGVHHGPRIVAFGFGGHGG
jgi:hypothetical protein